MKFVLNPKMSIFQINLKMPHYSVKFRNRTFSSLNGVIKMLHQDCINTLANLFEIENFSIPFSYAANL